MANPGWGGLAYTRLTLESTYATYAVANHNTANEMFIRRVQSNPQTIKPRPAFQFIRAADGLNRNVQVVGGFIGYAGTLTTLFYPSQAAKVLAWALNLTANDLSSFTLDDYDSIRSGLAYLGCKVGQVRISHAAEQQAAVLALDLIAMTKGASHANFVAPAGTAFPAEVPYTHFNSAGLVTIGAVRARYKSLDLTIQNVLIAPRDELTTISCLFFGGRNITLKLAIEYMSAADRATLETTPAPGQAVSVGWNNGVNTCTLDFKASNIITDLDDDLPLDNAAYQTLTVTSIFDRTYGGDVQLSTT